MKHKLRSLGICALAFCLCAIVLINTVFADSADVQGLFDYRSTSDTVGESMSPSALLEALLGSPLSAEETAYLDALSGISFRYSSAVPDSNISTFYDREEGTLEVSALPYLYTANNGAVVEWTPTVVTVADKTQAFILQDGAYVCCFEGLVHSGDFYMDVAYSCTLSFSQQALEQLINAAYCAGSAALEELYAYEARLAVYQAQKDAFDAYEAYRQAKEDYKNYQTAYDQYYNVDLPAYQAYLAKYEIYAEEKARYDAWQAYFAYEDFRVNKLKDFQAYVQYKNQVDRVLEKLEVMEKLFVTDSNGWQLYASLLGNTVATVVERKAELITAGCNADDINAAGDATVVLREVMEGYADLRKAKYASEHDKIAALYAYYTEHYQELVTYYGQLYGALVSLYDNSAVVSKLHMEGKLAHYQQFVGQLYITATCLDDNTKLSESWKISKIPLYDVVEECQRVPDTTVADPSTASMPETEVPPVEEVPAAEKPTGDQVRVPPTAPTPVIAEPTLPTPVNDPDKGTVPPYAEDPGTAPNAPASDSRVAALAEKVRNGGLTERAASAVADEYTLSTTVSRLVSIDNKKVISFYAADGKTLLYQTTQEYGTEIFYNGPDTAREPDAQYEYEFSGWNLPDGTRAQLIANSDMTLIAGYRTTLRFYTVTWELNGETETQILPYGATPESSFLVNRPSDQGYTYEFSGWSPAVETVTGDVIYTGTVERIPKLYTVTWVLGDREETESVPYGSYPAYTGDPSSVSGSFLYNFLSWDRPISRIEGDVTYTAQYEQIALAQNADRSVLEVMHSEDRLSVLCTQKQAEIYEAAVVAKALNKRLELCWPNFTLTLEAEGLELLTSSYCRRLGIESEQSENGVAVYTVACFNSLGRPVELDLPMTLFVKDHSGNTALQGSLLTDSVWQPFGAQGIAIVGSATLRVEPCYEIDVSTVEGCNISQIPLTAVVGQVIDLRIGCTFGYEVSAASVTMADGTPVTLDGLSFVMPNGAVTIELTVTQIVYHVTFVVDGVVISQADYLLGEQIVLPATPSKASDSVYDYTFRSWSEDISIAFGENRDPVYEAVFTATPVSAVDPYRSGHNNNFVITVILPIVAVLAVAGITFLVIRRTRKKRKAAGQAAQKTAAPTVAEQNLPTTHAETETIDKAPADDTGETKTSSDNESLQH